MSVHDRPAQSAPRVGRVLISSPQGHSGKTIVAVGLCELLRRRGLSVQPFKKGPDYIDPSWLSVAAGRSCRNLDLFLIPEEKLIQTFNRVCEEVDLAVVEGAMGLYDGLDSRETTAEIARLLNVPVLLVVNTSRMTTSIAAMVKGYQLFQTDIQIAGVILNYVSGVRHEKKLRGAVEQHCEIPVVGSIPKDQGLRIAERHLGLIPRPESSDAASLVERIADKLRSCLDLDGILAIAQRFGPPHLGTSRFRPAPLPPGEREEKGRPLPPGERTKKVCAFPQGEREPFITPRPLGERVGVRGNTVTRNIKIGILRDRAFNFYYPENLEALDGAGAEITFIDSLKDRLPKIDGLYIGGGFPEFFLKELEKNRGLRRDIASAVEAGLPVYAECAGLMYLCRSIFWQGRSYEMVGIIPAEVRISEKPEGHGYVVAEVSGKNPLFPIGLEVRGHEFHHSKISIKKGIQFAYQIRRGHGIDGQRDGVLYKNVFAAYTHLHALGTPPWAEAFVSLAAKEGKPKRR
jgi:cobyrinic acid a,c-diamide synthase